MSLLHSAAQIVTPLTNGGFRVIENGAIGFEGGRITYVGTSEEALASFPTGEMQKLSGKVVVPGFVDAHTHLIFGGDRCGEFLMRLGGATYQQIAAAGGGIQSTVRSTREASAEMLIDRALADLQRMLEHGTTTVELKSGYGLNWETERKMLNVASALRTRAVQDLVVTFLGAHDFPPDRSKEEYFQEILAEMLPRVAQEGLARFCDVFCDAGYYSVEQARAISLRARELGLQIKLHVDELADVHGAALAGEVRAVSADHLILANDEGIRKMAEAGVVAVLLPGTSIGLKTGQQAPARKMIDAGVRVALATDFNPGTCYCHSMQYVLQLGALMYRLTAEESLTAATLNAARAIGMEDQVGSLEPGKQMDCLIFDIPHYGYLFYNLGINHLETVIKRGKVAWSKKASHM